jgi:hypothetical protein
MEYIIDPVNNETFDNTDPQTRKTIVLLGLNVYENLPQTTLMFRDEHNDARLKQQQKTIEQLEQDLCSVREKCTAQAKHDNDARLKQKEDTINHLEEELRIVREKQAANLKHELVLRDTETAVRLKHQQELIEKLDQENKTIREKHTQEIEEQINISRKRFDVEYKRLVDDRDKYVQEQVDRTAGIYKQQLTMEMEKMEIQQSFNLRLQEELDNYKARKTKSLVSIGSIGENEVEEFLGSMFSEGKLTNMSKTSENSDFHFEYNGVRLLLEVKNYTNTIPQRPAIDKFLRDVVSTQVDGGIIVSCVDGIGFAFRKSILDWDFHQNIPTLYLTDFFSNPMVLYGGILAMIHYIRSKKEFERDNTQSAQEHKDMYLEILGDIETWVPLAEKATKQAKSTWETVNDLNQKIMNRLSKYDISTSALKASHQLTELSEEELLNAALVFHNKHNVVPTAKQLMEDAGITQFLINKAGGMRAIRKHIEANIKNKVQEGGR